MAQEFLNTREFRKLYPDITYGGLWFACRYKVIPCQRDPRTKQFLIPASEAQAAADFIRACTAETRSTYHPSRKAA